MSIEAIGSGIKTNITSCTGLKHIYAPNEMPETVNEFPTAIIQHVGTTYGITMGGDSSHDRHDFTIKVLVTNQDQPTAFNKILDYLARTGTNSVRQKIRADQTLGGTASGVTVISNSGQSIITWGGVQYLGTEFALEVFE